MKDNITILEGNICHALEGACIDNPEWVNEAQEMFLRFSEKNCKISERMALEWVEKLRPFLEPTISKASEPFQMAIEKQQDLIAFFKQRHINRYFKNA